MLNERIVDMLVAGDIDFLDRLSNEQIAFVVKGIRESEYKKHILFGSMQELKRRRPDIAFDITFDMEEYRDYWFNYFDFNYELLRDRSFLLFFLLSGDWAVRLVLRKLDKIVENNPEIMPALFRYYGRTKDDSILKKLAYHRNLDYRAWFMIELFDNYSHLITMFYDDIKKYLEDENGNVVKEEYVSKLAVLSLSKVKNLEMYEELKQFILDRYSSNTLAAELDMHGKLNEDVYPVYKEMLLMDIDLLFRTSKNYKYVLVQRYGEFLDKEMANEFISRLRVFLDIDESMVADIFINGLGDKFLEYVDKYLELSTGAKVISDCGKGSCARAFRIGDYVIKCSNKKWSMEDSLCPKGYLFAKNYEEDIVRNKKGEVTGAIEVQKYFTRPLVVEDYVETARFIDAMRKEGYYIKDVLADREGGANCYYLDSYLDADTDNPDMLPEWFKEEPVVLVDRDLVFRLENRNPKLKAINL